MTWYKTGTVSVTQGSNAVIGAGTSFIANSRVGDAFRGPDGEWYEVTNIASDIALSIAPSYQGEPVSGGIYSLAPMQGYVKDSADALRAATSVIASGMADMQEQVTAATEAAATAAQAEAVAVAKADIATAAADLSTQNKESTSQDATSAGQAALRAEAARDAVVGSEEAAAASAQAAAESAEEAEMVTRGKAASGANSDITSLSGLTTALSVAQGGTGSATGVPTMVGATASTAGIKGLVPASVAGDQAKFLRADGAWFEALTNPLTSMGDLLVGGAAGVPTRLPISAGLFTLRANAAGNGLEYSLESVPIGVAQSWNNVTASRALNTVYTNSTGRPIIIVVNIVQGAGGSSELQINSIAIARTAQTGVGEQTPISAIVPAGNTYRVITGGTITINNWAELR